MRLTSHNPATGEVVWSGSVTGRDDVRNAVANARDGLATWIAAGPDHRIAVLQRFAELAKQHADELATLVTTEAGKMPSDAAGEVKLLPGKVGSTITQWQKRQQEAFDVSPGVKARLRFKPIGVLAVFGPFNFPMHLPNGHIVPALLAGNAVVFKPSDHTPACGERLASLFHEAGLPSNVLQVVQGGRETGEALVDSDIDGVLFTGSETAGEAISKRLRYDQILALELGGNNPIVVHDPLDVDEAIDLVIQSAFVSSGQRCTCARRLIVTKAAPPDLLDRLATGVGQIGVGRQTDSPEPLVGPLISEEAARLVLAAQSALLDAGATSLVACGRDAEAEASGSEPDPTQNPKLPLRRPRTVVSPGLLDVTGIDAPDEEVFGPLLQLIRVDSLEDAIREANRTRFGLASGIVCRQRDNYERFASSVDAGCINWNRPLTGASGALPFGGVGRSGNFRPAGATAIDYCMTPVASLEAE
ncbi:MAG: succinylglutamate-semialdehyde dehydrogenase [Planctomycetota bacterium]